MNHKRIQRLCRDEGLRVLRRPKKRYRVGFSTVPADRLRATYPDQVWAIDFLFDQTADLRTLKILAITDEFTKEALAIEVDRGFSHARRSRQFALHRACAVAAGHPVDGEMQGFDRHIYMMRHSGAG